jgi:thiol-disulfide isomerase/thioredoxin
MYSLLIIFSATPCAACDFYRPIVERVAKRYPEVKVLMIDDENPIAKRVEEFPVTVILRGNRPIWWSVGTKGEESVERIFEKVSELSWH